MSIETTTKFISYDCMPKSHKRSFFNQEQKWAKFGKISHFIGIFTVENQQEVLFDKGTKYLVDSNVKVKDGVYRITLIEQ